jgi:hypothetical protein
MEVCTVAARSASSRSWNFLILAHAFSGIPLYQICYMERQRGVKTTDVVQVGQDKEKMRMSQRFRLLYIRCAPAVRRIDSK